MSEQIVAGRYRLDRLLGRGGMSEVWQAIDLELDRRVALKFLAPNADIARFEREARAVAALAHPNVTQLYDYGQAEGRPFMVLEYLGGGSLDDRLREQERLPDGVTLRIAAEVAAGLAHAHSRGVIHRDLKPANVLFDDEGRAKLADFGLARMATGEGTLTEAGTVLGTAAYISPEQAAGEPATAASDVYSFGVTLYRMLTGRLPFEADDPLELARLHRDSEPPPPTAFRDDAPPLLTAAVAAAMAKDPSRRPPDGAALLDLLALPGGDAVTTGAPASTEITQAIAPPPPSPSPPRGGRRSILVALLLALAVAGAALAWVVTSPAEKSTPAATQSTLQQHLTRRTATTRPPTTDLQSTTGPESTATKPATTTPATPQPPLKTSTAVVPTHSTTPTTTSATRPASTAIPTTPTTTTAPATTTALTTTATPTTTAQTTTGP